MKFQKVCLIAAVALIGSTLAHASLHATPILAVVDVPEPSSMLLGAGLLLAGLGVARHRLKK